MKTSKIHKVPLAKLKLHADNPRLIDAYKFDKLVQSLREFPEMMDIRPLLIDEDFVIMAGNMRYRALQELGIAQAQVVQITGLSADQKREILIKDNVSFGEWDYEALSNLFSVEQIEDWTGEVTFDYSELEEVTELDEEIESASKLVVRAIMFHLPNKFYEIKDMEKEYRKAGYNLGLALLNHLKTLPINETANP